MADLMPVLQAAFAEVHPYDRATITLGQTQLDVAVARTPQQWARGLAGSTEANGLLFIMPPGSTYAFHMADVDQHLAIALYDPDGRMVDIGVLAAKHGHKKPKKAYRYALEIPLNNRAGIRALLQASRLQI